MNETTSPNTAPGPTSKTAIRYPNLSGALVTVDSHREELPFGDLRLAFSAQCSACLDSYDRGGLSTNISQPRKWAAEHATVCRALPQPEPTDQ